ncbi:amylo-alpha-1,6-glucosidase [Sedimentisphaera salicampi]|uniref:Amylo-alpha-1,6-glucosidase n=1 Tax=Sedimentisphaera salicampi TaxID=1941349 RepID=A0A1W6LJP5_9BACT|nr:amylo-alpha-1,6-glucosidase [Sedimentisphaera salicampi]ARN55963.1 Amylo-alpha-1,6-glucosidase [Sedimentisphaera salicampi]
MNKIVVIILAASFCRAGYYTANSYSDARGKVAAEVTETNGQREFNLSTSLSLRDGKNSKLNFTEKAWPKLHSGSKLFDALLAMAYYEAELNSVSSISDNSFNYSSKLQKPYFQTGEKWKYVWTRDLAYSIELSLAGFDRQRCINSLLFKTSRFKQGVKGGFKPQIIQDTGSGGSWPVSTDRVVWALAAEELANNLNGILREDFLDECWPIIKATVEQDRKIIYDESSGLYAGEQSFLDWREQTYPYRTRDNVTLIAQSKSLSTNVLHYNVLKFAAKLAERNDSPLQKKYSDWSESLRKRINEKFYLKDKEHYSSLIIEGDMTFKTCRRDLLGESLAVLCGVADEKIAEKIVENYPTGKFGPPVVWPQDKRVAIYHNHGIWPFVTAYRLKAAKIAQNSKAVNQAVHSLVSQAALNLSNMENYDFASGLAYAESNGIKGPVINSRRQLWSVAGYIGMVQDVIFGFEPGFRSLKINPCVTGWIHSNLFRASNKVQLKGLEYHGRVINITLHLPDKPSSGSWYSVDEIKLNSQKLNSSRVLESQLAKINNFDIKLLPEQSLKDKINNIKNLSGSVIFAPQTPKKVAVESKFGLVNLKWQGPQNPNIYYKVYRNGELAADRIRGNSWLDDHSSGFRYTPYYYSVCSVYDDSGNTSHISRILPAGDYSVNVEASEMKNTGGNLVNGHHFENWGKPEHKIECEFTAEYSGTHRICAEYSNGSFQIYSGITCAVKNIKVVEKDSDSEKADEYLIMPHTEDYDSHKSGWDVYRDSTFVYAELEKGKTYKVLISEDDYSRNMSYFEHYSPYKYSGGGDEPYNYTNISQLKVLPCGE